MIKRLDLKEACAAFGVDDYSEECTELWGLPHFTIGALWLSEGKLLYSVIRTLKPKVIVEFGRNQGSSTNYIAKAIKMNGCGRLLSVDKSPLRTDHRIEPSLMEYVEIVEADALTYTLPCGTDFVYEDAAHTYDFNFAIMTKLKHELPEGTPIISHDVMYHPIEEANVDALGPGILIQLPHDSDTVNFNCGLGFWRV